MVRDNPQLEFIEVYWILARAIVKMEPESCQDIVGLGV